MISPFIWHSIIPYCLLPYVVMPQSLLQFEEKGRHKMTHCRSWVMCHLSHILGILPDFKAARLLAAASADVAAHILNQCDECHGLLTHGIDVVYLLL